MVNLKILFFCSLYTLNRTKKDKKKRRRRIFITNHLHTTGYHWFYPQQRKHTKENCWKKLYTRMSWCARIIIIVYHFINPMFYFFFSFFFLYSFTFMMILLGSGQYAKEEQKQGKISLFFQKFLVIQCDCIYNLSCGVFWTIKDKKLLSTFFLLGSF